MQIRRDHSSLRLGKSVCLLCDCGHQEEEAEEEVEEEEEEAVFISVVNTNEDPPNAHQAQHRPKPRVR